MAFREHRRFRSCCFVDIFCFTVCFHSGDRTRNNFAAGERMDKIRHLVNKRQKVLSKQRTVIANNVQDQTNRINPINNDLNQQVGIIASGKHRHRHHHGEKSRSKRSTSLLWNKLRFVHLIINYQYTPSHTHALTHINHTIFSV